MILKAERIAELLERGREAHTSDPLVVTPLLDLAGLKRSGSASIDLRLGTWFVSLRQARMTHLEIDEKEGAGQLIKTGYVPFGAKYYLHPGAFVLSITLEWIRLPNDLAAYVIGKSSWGRRGLIIATAAGVHPGFKGCLTLELSNVGELPVALQPGMTICQLCLHSVDHSKTDYIDQSSFVCNRKPTLGRVTPDPVAKKFAEYRGLGK